MRASHHRPIKPKIKERVKSTNERMNYDYKKLGTTWNGAPEKVTPASEPVSLLNGTTHSGSAQLPEGVLGPYRIEAGDKELWDRLGKEAFFKLIASRPVPELSSLCL